MLRRLAEPAAPAGGGERPPGAATETAVEQASRDVVRAYRLDCSGCSSFDTRSAGAYILSGMSSNRKSLSVRYIQHHLAAVLADAAGGEEIEVVRDGQPVARIVPILAASPACDWSDAEQRLQSVYPTPIGGSPASQIVADGRGER